MQWGCQTLGRVQSNWTVRFFFFLGGGGVFDYPEDLLPGTILVLLLRQLDLR